MDKKITLLLIDDHALFREGLKVVIERDKSLEIIGEAGTGAIGLEIAIQKQPDVILLDISLPDENGIALAKKLIKALKDVKILMVSMYSKMDYVTEAFASGAKGYVLKESASAKLLEGIHSIVDGNQYIDPNLSLKLVTNNSQGSNDLDKSYSQLTSREQEIMRLIAEGEHVKDIATQLKISKKTVENHKSNIMNKLNLKTSIDLIKYAARIGIIDLDSWT